MLKIKTLTTLLLAMMILQPLSAQERTSTVYTFRFVPGKDMFYIPWGGNETELARLETCVEQLKTRITAGEITLEVNGYCTSQGSEAENLAMAKIRSNRVKSEIIVRQGITEGCFSTTNHATGGNLVTVCIVVPKTTDDTAAREKKQKATSRARTPRSRTTGTTGSQRT